jgi:hypothetical protein
LGTAIAATIPQRLIETGERLATGHFIRIEPGAILDQRRFERRRSCATLWRGSRRPSFLSAQEN